MKDVTEAEFAAFLAEYPRPLRRSVALFCEPPVVTFDDPTLGDWQVSLVARHSFTEPGSQTPSGWTVKESP
jgi:hypothetical protein